MKSLFFLWITFGLVWGVFSASPTYAQTEDEVINTAKTAIGAASTKELVKLCHDAIEIGLGDQKATYSQSQAEFVLKDFFTKNPAKQFEYIHKGASKEGLKYVIGKYTATNGNTFRVYILVKSTPDGYRIDTLDFSRE